MNLFAIAVEATLVLYAVAMAVALARLVRFTWDYYLANPEFITLVNSANLHKARHVRDSEEFRHINRSLIGIQRRRYTYRVKQQETLYINAGTVGSGTGV